MLALLLFRVQTGLSTWTVFYITFMSAFGNQLVCTGGDRSAKASTSFGHMYALKPPLLVVAPAVL